MRARIQQRRERREAARDFKTPGKIAGPIFVHVRHADDLDKWQAAKPLDMRLADGAGPDDAGLNRLSGVHAFSQGNGAPARGKLGLRFALFLTFHHPFPASRRPLP